jgi:hypothetical protein
MHAMAVFSAAVSLFASPTFAPATTPPPPPPPPDKITINVVTVNGSGCPSGTAAVAISPDNTAFTVTYSQYNAMVGVGAKPTDSRKNCQINLQVHVPQGFTYAIAQADYRGYASLASGATAMERANYYFQGQSPTAYAIHSFTGALEDDWQATDTTDLSALVYAPCGEQRLFNINTELRANAGTSNPRTTTSFISMDSTDGAINTTYHFAWKVCP